MFLNRILIVFLFLFLITQFECRLVAQSSTPTIEELIGGVIDRVNAYPAIEFEISCEMSVDGKQHAFRDLFAIRGPTEIDKSTWRRWIRSYRDIDTPFMDRAIAWDGKECASFTFNPESAEHGWNEVLIQPFLIVEQWEQNVFDRMLTMNVLSSTTYEDEDGVLSRQVLSRSTVEGIAPDEFLGRKCWRVTQRNPVSRTTAIVLGPPSYLMLQYQAADLSGNPICEFQINKLEETQFGIFPTSGKFTQHSVGAILGFQYIFEVKNITPVSQETFANWTPIWPPATSINRVGGKSELIQPSREMILARQAKLLKDRRSMSKSSFAIAALVVFAFAIIFLCVLRYRRRKYMYDQKLGSVRIWKSGLSGL